MPLCSLIVVRGDANADSETGFEYAQLAGVKFIQLRHELGSARTEHTARGFQGVEVKVNESRGGGRTFAAQWSERDGKACRAHRPLVFSPVGRARLLTAYLPDSPFNRRKLAEKYFHSARWMIVDPGIHANVKKDAEEIEKHLPVGPTKEQVITAQAGENASLRDQNEELRHQLKEANERTEVITAAARTVKELPQDRKDAIREIVHKDNEAVLSKLKEQSPNGWANTKKYKDLIQPLIDEMERVELEKMNADDPGAGIQD